MGFAFATQTKKDVTAKDGSKIIWLGGILVGR